MNRTSDYHRAECSRMAKILITPLREVARRHGYALGVHGSLQYDIDLIAVPWDDSATDAESLADAIRKAVEAVAGKGYTNPLDPNPTQKPHGRLAWSFHFGVGPYVDLSVTPRIPKKGSK
jgi:hypothetical protein